MKPLDPVVGVPPHIQYMCAGCEQEFSTAERTAYFDHRLPQGIGTPYYCSRCAIAENRRRAA